MQIPYNMLRPTSCVPVRVSVLFFILFSIAAQVAFAQCPNFSLPTGTVCAGGECSDPAEFTYTGAPVAPGSSYVWDFGVPNDTTDRAVTTTPSATYAYPQPGSYNVTLKIVTGGDTVQQCSQPLNVQGIDEFTIGPDINLGPQEEEICKGDNITLTPEFQNGSAPPGATYLWSDGSTSSTLNVDTAGCYSVEITDPATGCTRTQKVEVSVYKPDPNEPNPADQQDQARWFFGNGSEVRFPGGQPEIPDSKKPFTNIPEGSSSVLSATGDLLFYTDGITVYDSTGTPMLDANNQPVTGANGLNGSNTTAQGVHIVSQPGCDECQSVYYVFTTTEISGGGSVLSYSVVDMRGGLGRVTQKNVELFTSSTERVISIGGTPDPDDQQAQTQETTWIVTHDFNTNTFRVYPLTPQGVGAAKTYAAGATHGADVAKGQSYMKASADGTKLAVVIPGAAGEANTVEVFDFDPATGEVSEPVEINLGNAPPTAYGLEFAGDQLYVSLTGSGSEPSRIEKFNLSVADSLSLDSLTVALSRDTVVTSTNPFGALQLGPDQRIYVAIQGATSLGVITNPTAADSVEFQEAGLDLEGGTSGLGLPNNSPTDSRGYGTDFSYDGPACTPAGVPVTYTFQAQLDRAANNDGTTPTSFFTWRFPGSTVQSNDVQQQTQPTTFTFPGPGTYTVTLEIRTDCQLASEPDTTTKTIVINQAPPPIELGPPQSACEGETIPLDAYPNATGPAAAQYFWLTPDGQTVVAGETFNATLEGTYRVFAVVGECIETDSINIVLNGPPDGFLGNDTILCQGGGLLLDAGTPGATYQWFNVTANQAISETTQTIVVNPTATTTYRATVTDIASGCSNTDEITVRVGTPSLVTATPTPASACNGANDGSITLTLPPNEGPYTFVWTQNGTVISNDQNLTGRAPGTYSVTVTNANGQGCPTTVTATINSTQNQLDYTIADVTLNCNQTTGNLQLTPGATNTGTPTQIRWFNQNTNEPIQSANDALTLTNQPPGTYRAELAEGTCTFRVTGNILPPQNQPVLNATFRITNCNEATIFAGQQTDVDYALFGPDGTQINLIANNTATVTQPGAYRVEGISTADNTCRAETTLNIDFPDPPTVNAGADQTICQNQTATLTATTTGPVESYTWTLNGNRVGSGRQIGVTAAGTYTVTVRANGCSATDQVQVTVTPTPAAPAVVNPRLEVCAGSGIPQFEISNPTGTYQWYSDPNLTNQVGSGTTFLPAVQAVGVYNFYVRQGGNNACPGPATLVSLTIKRSPVVDLGSDRNSCTDSLTVLDANVNGVNNGATFLWSTTQTTPTIRPTRSGTYSVTVTIDGCTATDEVTITVLPAIQTRIPNRELPICLNDIPVQPVTLDAGTGQDFTYRWLHSGETTQTVEVSDTGTYVVEISQGECTKREEIRVTARCEPRIFVPTAFTPNELGPAENETLAIKGQYATITELVIYNRWGEVVYKTENIELTGSAQTWDGKYLGQSVPVGSYAWKITYTSQDFPERESKTIRGGVMILK